MIIGFVKWKYFNNNNNINQETNDLDDNNSEYLVDE